MQYQRYKVTLRNIEWDDEGQGENLPSTHEATVDAPFERAAVEAVMDDLSDNTGWCIACCESAVTLV